MTGSGHSFFDASFPAWETYDPKREINVAKVAFVDGPGGVFDYKIPDRLADAVVPGIRVLAPLGVRNRSVTAYCVEVVQRDASEFAQDAAPAKPAKRAPAKSQSATPLFAEADVPAPEPEPETPQTKK
ncbi:MAG: hypothetical protein ACI4QC_04265, partial [Thermoguttaceae bacterium]